MASDKSGLARGPVLNSAGIKMIWVTSPDGSGWVNVQHIISLYPAQKRHDTEFGAEMYLIDRVMLRLLDEEYDRLVEVLAGNWTAGVRENDGRR